MTFFYSKQQACKPDSVPAESSARDIPAGFHHLSCPAITCRIHRPTPRHRASSPDRRYTWSFNPWSVRLAALPPRPVSSYLTFSPFPRPCGQGGYFLLHLHTLADIFPLGSMALCVVRTFLPRPEGLERWNGMLPCKDTQLLKNLINYYFCCLNPL